VGILSAMNKSVGGLSAQSFALENISGNIANSQTTAYKRTDTSFQDLVGAGTSRVSLMPAGNVRATARSTIGLQGAIESNAVETFMGIKGNGFFTVKQKLGETDGTTVFGTGLAYTRRGDYQIDKEGYLINGAGYYLAGLPIDKTTNNPVGDTADVIKIDKSPIPAEGTERITYKLNLPETPKTTNYLSKTSPVAADSLYDDSTLTVAGEINKNEEVNFIANSISGGAVTAYDANGTAVNVQLRWAKTDDTPATWKAYYLADSNASGTDVAWQQLGGATQDFEFDASGNLTPALTELTLTGGVTVDGSTLADTNGDLTLAFGDAGLTQAADISGKANVQQLTQDGLPIGNFVDVSITDGGRVVANYSNGKTVDLFEIPLVSFSGEAALRPMDGGAYAETKESGPAVSNAPGQIVGAALENSNVDIGEEFTKLIVTQQAFSANSKVISTADQMMSSVLNIIR
jgi:flagellar hook protein FlgE